MGFNSNSLWSFRDLALNRASLKGHNFSSGSVGLTA